MKPTFVPNMEFVDTENKMADIYLFWADWCPNSKMTQQKTTKPIMIFFLKSEVGLKGTENSFHLLYAIRNSSNILA